MQIVTVQPAAVRALLVANELPVDDLDDPAIELLGAFAEDALVGAVGLQTCGDLGLLRSLAVAPEQREQGVARALCERVVARVQERGLAGLYLLTTSAAGYFARHGFVAIPRDETPDAIRACAQFASLCPSSATVMQRRA